MAQSGDQREEVLWKIGIDFASSGLKKVDILCRDSHHKKYKETIEASL